MRKADSSRRREIPFVGPFGRTHDGDRHLRIAQHAGDGDQSQPISGMDVPREPKGPGRRIALILAVLLLLVAVTIFLGRLDPALPGVDSDLIVLASVERGMLPLEIRGWGELKSDQLHRVESSVGGRVVKVHVEPGDVVSPGTPLIKLSSPDLALEAARAEQEFTAARAAFTALRRSIGTQRLEREASLAALSAELTRAGRSVERREALFARGEISEAELMAATDAVYAIEKQLHVQEEMLALLNETGDEQVLLEKNRLVALAEVLHRENERLSALHVEASHSGLVEEVSTAVGDWVSPGTELIRLIRPEQLQAELKVPLPGATRIRLGDAVLLVDAVGDTTDGKVRVVGETLPMKGDKYARVSVQLSKPPRTDAAVDAGVDAIINIGLLDNALFVKRPAWAADDGVASVFRVDPDGKTAERVKVKFGTGSWDRIQVLDGLEEGDVIIVSDMSRFDDVDCVRLEP